LLLNEEGETPVEVLQSKCGYVGPGVAISRAYGRMWLVRVEIKNESRIITVDQTYLRPRKIEDRVKKK